MCFARCPPRLAAAACTPARPRRAHAPLGAAPNKRLPPHAASLRPPARRLRRSVVDRARLPAPAAAAHLLVHLAVHRWVGWHHRRQQRAHGVERDQDAAAGCVLGGRGSGAIAAVRRARDAPASGALPHIPPAPEPTPRRHCLQRTKNHPRYIHASHLWLASCRLGACSAGAPKGLAPGPPASPSRASGSSMSTIALRHRPGAA